MADTNTRACTPHSWGQMGGPSDRYPVHCTSCNLHFLSIKPHRKSNPYRAASYAKIGSEESLMLRITYLLLFSYQINYSSHLVHPKPDADLLPKMVHLKLKSGRLPCPLVSGP